jgi:hypothetical protein
MSKIGTTLTNYDSQSLIDKKSAPIFILCDLCYWCATYFDKTRIPEDNMCPMCAANNNELTSFPIASNESFRVNYSKKRGIEFEFRPRSKRSKL